MEPPGLGEARTELQPYRASSPATVRRHRRSPAATHGGRSSPPHPRLSYGCQSMRRVTEITRSCSVGRAGSSPASAGSPELAGRRLPCFRSLTAGARVSVPRAGGRAERAKSARVGVVGRIRFPGPAQLSEIKFDFYYFDTDFCDTWKNRNLGF
jgi:hypothetical protein